jgi:hypothetical protein
MTQGFQQQDRFVNFSFPKSAPSPQHGGRADGKTAAPSRPARTFEPRPGH